MNTFKVLLTLIALSGSATAATYTVKAGDTLSGIAQRSGIQPQQLMQLNRLASPTLRVGQRLNTGSASAGASRTAVSTAGTSSGGYVRTAALRFLGIPYVLGGTGSRGMDCSSFTQAVYRAMGISLPRTTATQFRVGSVVGRSNLKAGDLIFFNTLGRGVSHVGIYLGNGQFANANSYIGRSTIDSMSNPYWSSRFISARRVL